MTDFVELTTHDGYMEAFHILTELDETLDPDRFLAAMDHALSANSKLFAIRNAGNIVSVAAVWFLMTGRFEKLLWIHAFVTTKAQRSKGFGKLLLSGIEREAQKRNCSELRVHAHREKAIQFWKQKAGFDGFSSVLRRDIST
ncbi:MAG: GNAT family N-acetyltransferase [Desulfosarcinaceae bacterium]|nr:GNAT family N-acetyltransferase [Desulfosarcinaceae bacterium]